jgi:hypothetical protein
LGFSEKISWKIKKIIFHLETALGIALMALEQKLPLSARIAANGPTVSEVIHRGLALAKEAQQSVHPTVATVAPPEVESTTRNSG